MSQQNVLIDRPLIRPRPVAYLGKNYYLYDNFADGKYENRVGVAANGFRYQEWTVQSGTTWDASAGYLTQTEAQKENVIETPSTKNTGTWEAKVKLGANVSTYDAVKFRFMHDGTSGNDAQYHGASPDLRLVTGATVLINPTVAIDTNEHTVKVTRDSSGNFELFWDGVSQGTGTNTEVTTSTRMEVNCNCDGSAAPSRIDNIKAY